MKNGGAREGAGRPKGGLTKKTQELIAKIAADGQITPLEYMLGVMRNELVPEPRRDQMAIASAPYIHPKLSSMQASVKVTNVENELSELE